MPDSAQSFWNSSSDTSNTWLFRVRNLPLHSSLKRGLRPVMFLAWANWTYTYIYICKYIYIYYIFISPQRNQPSNRPNIQFPRVIMFGCVISVDLTPWKKKKRNLKRKWFGRWFSFTISVIFRFQPLIFRGVSMSPTSFGLAFGPASLTNAAADLIGWRIWEPIRQVGGWTNPFEKIWVKMGSSSPSFGMKIKISKTTT